ncbi:MAG: hypothetical protein KC593_08100 [Myxococcales bacterium]|nr:hypothetical protein [Myxococcales bacterium]MCB9630352.1 hypothetical protein [Sandaracinaceae bacterium]
MTVLGKFLSLVGFVALMLGCSSVRSTSIATGATGPAVDAAQVAVAATYIPEGATEIAIVETHGNVNEGLDELLLAFRTEVGAQGGNFGKVDSMRTRFEMQTVTRTETYSCGTSTTPQTCSRIVTQQVEVGVTTIVGRAFRVGGVQ